MKSTFLKSAAVVAALATLVAVGVACSGCGYDEKKPVAVFDGGKNVITVGDFVYHYKRAVEMAPPQNKPVVNTYDDAKGFLDDLINSRALEMEADRLGYGKDPALASDVANFRSGLLREKTQKRIKDGVKVTEAEILDHYNKNKQWYRVSFIMCDKKEQADKASADLAAGKPWNDVVKTYTIFAPNRDQGGAMPEDFMYTGDNASRAVYATPVGKYTPVIAMENGQQWFIFRVEKKVPGSKDEYAKIKDEIRESIIQYRVSVQIQTLIAKLRKEVKITVNKEAYDDALKDKTADTIAKYGNKKVNIADAGGVAVPFDNWFGGMINDLRMPNEMIDEFKQKDPAGFKTFAESRLKDLEDGALLEYDAVRSGIDKNEDFIREVNKYRAGKMVDRLYVQVFLPTVPPITDDDLKAYYEGHLVDFQDPERADIFLIAVPDKDKASELQTKVKGGADPAAAIQPYVEEFDARLRAAGGSPEKSDPATLPLYQVITVRKDPLPATPGSPNAEPPLIAELRPRVFAVKEGEISEVFRLKDGRWAFFRYSKYFPMVQHPLDEPSVKGQVKDLAYNEKVASPEVDRMCQKWFKDLRAKHKIEINEGALKMAFKKVQKMQ